MHCRIPHQIAAALYACGRADRTSTSTPRATTPRRTQRLLNRGVEPPRLPVLIFTPAAERTGPPHRRRELNRGVEPPRLPVLIPHIKIIYIRPLERPTTPVIRQSCTHRILQYVLDVSIPVFDSAQDVIIEILLPSGTSIPAVEEISRPVLELHNSIVATGFINRSL